MAEEKKIRIVFMGTPEFAATVLRKLLEWPGCEVRAVFTQPDRPSGRGQVLTPSPVKTLALERSIPVHQPESFKKNPESIETLRAMEPDLLVVAAYGLILPQAVLDIPPLGAINVHASLLPKYRGAAPIQRALLNGEHVTGISIMQMEAGLDTGPILLQRALAIGIDDTAETLHDGLAEMGGRLLVESLERLKQGRLTPIPQDPERATYAAKLTKEEGHIDFNRPAEQVHNTIRAMHPWPGAYFHWNDPALKQPIKLTLYPGKIGEPLSAPTAPGKIIGLVGNDLAIACADRAYLVHTIKPEGRKPQSAESFACGYLSRCFATD